MRLDAMVEYLQYINNDPIDVFASTLKFYSEL